VTPCSDVLRYAVDFDDLKSSLLMNNGSKIWLKYLRLRRSIQIINIYITVVAFLLP